MALLGGESIPANTPLGEGPRFNVHGGEVLLGATTMVYKMTGTDRVLSTQDSWEVMGSPDYTGASYAAWCTTYGLTPLTTPLRFVHIADSWPAP